ncbi:MAG: PIN domain-containing protein [Chitinivibrionales bacterium]|nr:PIN domain-containing protein [Chitinivibrionales bacterium]
MSVLVDSSVWIDYLRTASYADTLDLLIEENLVVTNDLILGELIPPLEVQKKKTLVSLLREVKRQPMAIDWEELIKMQTTCLSQGINGVGVPDLLIVQNAIQGDLKLLSRDKHFSLIAKHIPVAIYS